MTLGKDLCFRIGEDIWVKVYKERTPSRTRVRVRVVSPRGFKVIRVKEMFDDDEHVEESSGE